MSMKLISFLFMSIRLRKNLTHIPEINSVEYILCMQLFMHSPGIHC